MDCSSGNEADVVEQTFPTNADDATASVGDESYFIKKAKTAQHSDQYTAKAWILAAKTLFPNNFDIQFEVYEQEKVAKNHLEAAKCFSHIVLTFPTPPPELWREITQLTSALRIAEDHLTPDDEFYVEMFKHISFEVQNKILSSLNTENNLDHCKFVLLLLKKYPQALQVHLPRLLEALVQNNNVSNQQTFIKMLLLEVVPLIVQQPPQDLSPNLVHRILTLGLEFYTSQMFLFNNALIVPAEFGDTANLTTTVCWKRIFEIAELCGQILHWDPFEPYDPSNSQDVYWQRLMQIVSTAAPLPSENKQILFYSTILFILSLQEYLNGLKHKVDDIDIRYVLIEGFSDEIDPNTAHRICIEPPSISSNPPCEKEVPIAFRTAVQCWQLLHSNEILQMDFKQLLLSLPCSTYVNQFLVDLAFYVGQPEEAQTILNDSTLCSSNLEKNLRYLSLTLHQPTFKQQAFDFLLKILPDLPPIVGHWMQDISTCEPGRHVVFLPLTKRAILQYCVKILVNALKVCVYCRVLSRFCLWQKYKNFFFSHSLCLFPASNTFTAKDSIGQMQRHNTRQSSCIIAIELSGRTGNGRNNIRAHSRQTEFCLFQFCVVHRVSGFP